MSHDHFGEKSLTIGHIEKYHNILKIVVWVVLRVNLTFALSFAHDFHGLSKKLHT